MPPDFLHIVGYLTGAVLYAMLLAMAARDRAGDRLTLGTAWLGLSWNAGEIGVYALRALGSNAGGWLSAASFTSLGLLAAVVVHSVWRGSGRQWRGDRLVVLPLLTYTVASVAGVMHAYNAATGATVPNPAALVLLTGSVLALAPVLLMATRKQTNAPRAMWLMALAVFTVSALHLGNFHGPGESWVTELLGHHASIPLAFAILYQEYRFALADLFLKRALSMLAAVGMVFGAWAAAGPLFATGPTPRAMALLLILWTASLWVFPRLRTAIGRFVDRIMLGRANYAAFVDELTADIERCSAEQEVLKGACASLAAALTATRVQWEHRDRIHHAGAGAEEVVIPTTDSPHPVLVLGPLAGGRRLLSDDVAMLERVAFVLGRRIDTIRLTVERYEQVLREREMRTLATEAELRALRAQINPHFLFNALTTIGYLIHTEPPRALATLLRLTTLLRGVLRSDGEFTTLGRERELVASYLAIERERFEERLELALDIPSELDDVALPSLIIQPLVENAVKHGIAPARDGGRIAVSATITEPGGDLRIIVRNTGARYVGRVAGDEGGVGLQNVERRLATLYGDRAALRVAATPDGETIAELRLPAAARTLPAQRRVG